MGLERSYLGMLRFVFFLSRSIMGWKRLVVIALIFVLIGWALYHARYLGQVMYPLHYREVIYQHSEEYGVDPYLVAAVIRVESKFDPHVISSEGAVGLMQIMPATGAWLANELDIEEYEPDILTDPEWNILLGTYYLSLLNEKFGGNTAQVLAAYNGGQGNVSKWLLEKSWDGDTLTLEQIPFSETRSYVRRVIEAYERYRWLYGEEEKNSPESLTRPRYVL